MACVVPSRVAVAALSALMVSVLLGVGAMAKEPPNYGPLTIQIVGAGGANRSITTLTPEERQNANYLVSELGMVTSAETVSASPPALRAHYQIVVKQQANVVSPLPWSNLSSVEFYFYPGAGANSYWRLRVGDGSRPDRELWLIVFPGAQSLIEAHLAGLPPMQDDLAGLPNKQRPADPGIVIAASLLVLAAIVGGAALLAKYSSGHPRPRARPGGQTLPET